MTRTFTTEHGNERAIYSVHPVDAKRLDLVEAEPADLLRALGLSTEGGPTWSEETGQELTELRTTVEGSVYTPREVGLRLLELLDEARTSRQLEVDRLTVELEALRHTAREKELDALLFEERTNTKRAESELTATKARVAELEALPAASRLEKVERDRWETMWRDAEQRAEAAKEKLAEVERERDDAAKSAEYLAARYNRTSEELERARRVVEAAKELATAESSLGNGSVALIDALRADRKLKAALAALASAAPGADRTEAAKCCFACGDRLMTVWFAPEFCDEQCARDWSNRSEPPRAEAGESESVCEHRYQVLRDEQGHYFCTNCMAPLTDEESKPEPQPSGGLGGKVRG